MKQNKKNDKSIYMIVSLVVNTLLSGLKIVFGIFIKSSAIISDGIHSFSDLVTDIVAIIGLKLSNKKEDVEHPLGHGKFEYITSLIVGFIIMFFAYELFMHVISGENSVPSSAGIYVVIFTIIAKIVLSTFLINRGKKFDNQILYSSGKESMNDVYSSIIVLLGLVLAQFNLSFSIYLDKAVSIIIVILIFKTGFLVVKRNINLLLGVNASKEEIKKMKAKVVENVEGVKSADKLVLLKYGPCYKVIIDIQVSKSASVYEGHEIADRVKKYLLKDEKIDYVKVHVEPYMKK